MTRRHQTVIALVGVCVTAAALSMAGSAIAQSVDEPYLLISSSRTGQLEDDLAGAVARGYAVRTSWNSSDEMFVLLERDEGEAVPRDVKLVATLSRNTMGRELAEAAAEGYRLLPGGLLRNPSLSGIGGDQMGQEAVVLLGRSAEAREPVEYLVTGVEIEYQWDKKARRYHAKNYKDFEHQLQQTVDQGFRLAGLWGNADPNRRGKGCDLGVVLLWERPAATADAAASGQGPAYRLVEGFPGPELNERLGEAVADGYRLTPVSALFHLPATNHVAFVMERDPDSSIGRRYLVLASMEPEGLENQLAAAGAHGYRLRDWALRGDPLVAIVEHAGDGGYAYELFETDRLATLQRELTEAVTSGRVAAVTSARRWSFETSSDLGVSGLGGLFGSRPSFRLESTDPRHVGIVEHLGDEEGTLSAEPWPGTGRFSALEFPVGNKPSDMEKDLNTRAKSGYRALLVANAPDGETLDITLETQAGQSGPAEYRVLTATRDSTLEEELNAVAGEGFRLVAGGVFAKPTKMGAIERGAVMERVPGVVERYEYLLLTTGREATLRDEIDDAVLDGYALAGRQHLGRGHAAFMERAVGAGTAER